MGKRGPARGLVGGVILAWGVACGVDSFATGNVNGTGGAGGEGRAQAPAASSPLPATLRMTALRAMQTAPGHDFTAGGLERRLSARIGAHGATARVEISDDLVSITPEGKNHGDMGAFGLRTVHIGRLRSGSALSTLPPVLAARSEGQEAVLARDRVEERYLAGPLGLEQSFRIVARPAGGGPLTISVLFDGLAPRLASKSKGLVELVDVDGRTRAVYRDLAAVDAEGRELDAWMEVEDGIVALVVEDEGAAYPLTVDPLIATEQAKVTMSNGTMIDYFGGAVSVSGDTAIVGASQERVGANSSQGAAHIFVRSGTTWTHQAMLSASDGAMSDHFGCAVSLSGDTAIIGASNDRIGANYAQGSAYVFERTGTTWSQVAKLTASDATSIANLGTSVSLSGDIAVVGAVRARVGATLFQGAAYVFVRSGTGWAEEAKLTASDGASNDSFGGAVGVSGETAVVGAHSDDVGLSFDQGSAYVFVRSGTNWSQQAQLTGSDSTAGDGFGGSVTVSGDTLIVGATQADIGPNGNQGSAYVFVRAGTTWAEEAKLTASDGLQSDRFGCSVGLAGATAVVGASMADGVSLDDEGAAYVFLRRGTTWSHEATLTANDGAHYDEFGGSVSVSAGTVLVGAGHDDEAHTDQGSAYMFVLEAGLGDPCGVGLECLSGFCADSVCCDGACAMGTCDACAAAGGATADGTCTLLTGPTCDDGDACTQTDTCELGTCSGSISVVCAASDQCHDPGACDSTTGICSSPPKADGSTCDDGDACTQSDGCEAGACVGRNPVVCLPGGQCTDSCDAATGLCAAIQRPDGTACDDGDACTQADSCLEGACTGSSSIDCAASDQCHDAGRCNPADGTCSNPTKLDDSSCDDGNACTTTDVCQAGVCASGNPVVCAASDECHDAGTCDSATGLCSTPARLDGTPCSDGEACTWSDSCQAGVCVGGPPVVCAAADECHHAGSCDPADGTCTSPMKADGSGCDDGDACTQLDTCRLGTCWGANPVLCSASDQCHDVGSCEPATGLCSSPASPNGTPCDDGNACSQTDSCRAGACTGGAAVACAERDQCHDAGTCDSSTGLCTNPAKTDGTACDDGSPCTQTDSCQAGSCMGGNPVVCAASDQCHETGSCDQATGRCSDPLKPSGSLCDDGDACTTTDACQAGICTGSGAVVCAASDQCHEVGACTPGTGICTNPPKPDGSGCDDGDACTQTDTCGGGACSGAAPVVCAASDQCHDAGSCDPVTGRCSNPAKLDGSPCDDGDACTETQSCEAGTCTGSSAVICAASDQCHEAGTCDPSTGECSYPASPDGSACDDGDPCTRTDSCLAGSCTGGDPIVCSASGECRDAGSCDPATGACSDPAAIDGTSCDDGNGCTSADLCQGGFCAGTPITCEPLDECHAAGRCSTGTCLNPAKPDGTRCATGACAAGVCIAGRWPTEPGERHDGAPASDGGCGCSSGKGSDGGTGTWVLVAALAVARAACRRRQRLTLPGSRQWRHP